MPKLSVEERDAFLQERGHLARIATLQADGRPSVVPVWFVYEAGKIVITPRKHSAFWANIQHDPRVAVTIDEETGLYRKVLVEGDAEVLYPLGHDDEWRDIYRRITLRYVDEASGDYYLTETHDQPRALIGVPLASAKVMTWRMPGEDEPFSGIWATRFYDRGTKMRERITAGNVAASGDKLKVG